MARQVVAYDDLECDPAMTSASSILAVSLAHAGQNTSTSASQSPDVSTIGTHTNSSVRPNPALQHVTASTPPAKKRRTINGRNNVAPNPEGTVGPQISKKKMRDQQTNGSVSARHWDDPGAQVSSIQYDDEPTEEIEDEVAMDVANDDVEEEEEESRELTHEEIWDDSVLIDAWNAANEEYEAIHGKGKNWKKDRVHKSPLWYNIPPESKKTKSRRKTKETTNDTPPSRASLPSAYDNDSAPLDFHSYIPTHDASLNSASALNHDARLLDERNALAESGASNLDPAQFTSAISPAPGETVSTDEAFSRAMSAMYWCGYWTAVYHTQRRLEAPAAGEEDEETFPEEERVEAEDLVATQR